MAHLIAIKIVIISSFQSFWFCIFLKILEEKSIQEYDSKAIVLLIFDLSDFKKVFNYMFLLLSVLYASNV